jgi:Ribbon-helix-helix protein, copG family
MNENRVNARIDDATQERLNDLILTTGQSVSHVVREAIAVYHVQMHKRQPLPRRLLAMVGKYDSGHADSATNYKAIVAEAIEEKYRRTQPPLSKVVAKAVAKSSTKKRR